MTKLHEWLQTWGEAIEPDNITGSFARRLRDYLKRETVGLVSVAGARRKEQCELLILEVETNRPQRPTYPILQCEPVGVILSDAPAPPVVLSLRPDFPDTPHQNWVPYGAPFSICVDDRPWQEARPLYTPAELLHRIMKWFERAGRGELHDARQPLDPFFAPQGVHIVIPRNVFELGSGLRAELIGTSHAQGGPVIVVRPPHPGELSGSLQGAFVFVVFRIAAQAMRRMRCAPNDLATLVRELSERGVDLAGELATRISGWSVEGGNNQARLGSRLGIVLQMPIITPDGKATGVSDNVAFLSLATVGEIGVALGRLDLSPDTMRGGARYVPLLSPGAIDDAKLARMAMLMGIAHVEFDQHRAAELTGMSADPPKRVVQIGAGTAGSMAAEMMARQGVGTHWTIIDPDYLLPHNLARHTLPAFDVGMHKSIALANHLTRIRADLAVQPLVADVLSPGDQGLAIDAAINAADLLIDAAASVPVARLLSDHPGKARRMSMFFNPAGTASIMLVESGDRSVDLRMLEATYYGEILRQPELNDHLSQSAEAIPYAGACRAVTNRISPSRAQTLTGLAVSGLAEAISKPEGTVRVWSISPDGDTKSHVSVIGTVRSVSMLGWTITLPQAVEDRIVRMRTEKLPAETGGVLFGIVDLVKCRIDIVEAWPAPPDSKGSEAEFTRGTKGLRASVEQAIGRTLEQVRYVGEWHSHPRRARTTPSSIDLEQLGWLTATLSMDGCPALMLIAGDRGVRINLGEIGDADENAA
jgi:Prokaryotic E2 family A/ThiF family/Prokaryotic homologs of the JAB domain